ncbi:hypothetical protein FA13DRAFT_976453 [Coprinellus micaceus]|uniref:Uncharacterized protein n=1 Tax=Coprinellus micaceus TaxID=71717 RepID=A0A4Y7SZE6_COPMI|nr:hypothetical protein FA13DRAFT_976453 [Coprinellus micaceus]
MTAPGNSALSRFHAIISATPQGGFGPPVINPQHFRPSDNGNSTQSGTAPTKKRKRGERDDPERKDNYGIDGRSLRQANLYQERQQLLNALKDQFQRGPDVEFHGCYEQADTGVSHKQRIQTITHEIWRTTGYRFTVKDHPRINNGHKTRFWCSQDDAHKNKAKGARAALGDVPKPRVTSSGDPMAKTRYPCRSRLLISSRDSDRPGIRIITIRLAHHLAHEPYIDSTLPVEVSKTICESFGWFGDSSAEGVDTGFVEGSSSARDGHFPGAAGSVAPPLGISPSQLHQPDSSLFGEMEDDDDDDDMDREEDDDPQHFGPTVPTETLAPQPGPSFGPGSSSAPSYVPHPPPPISPPIQPNIHHRRMRALITNIREFCDGLDYQLQFNDTRMLEVVEKEGSSFLRLVEDCLRKEGRLVSVPSEHNVLNGN